MSNGWIKLHRRITEWQWYTEPNTRITFEHVLLTAAHKATVWRGIKIETGETIESLSSIARSCGLSVMQIRTAIANLQLTGELTQRQHGKHRILKVKNYEDYQYSNTEDNTKVTRSLTRSQHDDNTMITTDNKVKKVKKVKKYINMSANADAHVLDELETFVQWLNSRQIFPNEKTITDKVRLKWNARRKKYSARDIAQAFANLLNEPDKWKIEHNGQRPLSWWLHSDERIESMQTCHLKSIKPTKRTYI